MDTLDSSEVSQHFYNGIELPMIKEIFHCLDADVYLDDIFNSPVSALYCTFYSNMCDVVLQHRVKPGENRSKLDDRKIYENFRKLARMEWFADIDVVDIPIRPREPPKKKRPQNSEMVPLRQRDPDFEIFGTPPGLERRESKVAMAEAAQKEAKAAQKEAEAEAVAVKKEAEDD